MPVISKLFSFTAHGATTKKSGKAAACTCAHFFVLY